MAVKTTSSTLQSSYHMVDYDVVIVGAGPYGLSTAAHLLERGLRVMILGKPLNTWREYMPKDMLLRSHWWASNMSDPGNKYGMENYFREKSSAPYDPLTIESFIDYGLWFQRHAVPNIDETYVKTVDTEEGHFVLTLVDERIIRSLVVVMAPGLMYYTYRPSMYDHLSADRVSHSSQHNTFDNLAGKRVVVVGGGQSALETAALVNESGAEVQLVSRSPLVWIPYSGPFPEHRPLLERIRAPKAGIAAGWFNWFLEHFPYSFQRLPRLVRDRLLSGPGRYGPMGASWLKPRIEGKVQLHVPVKIEDVKETGNVVTLTLSDNQKLEADHLILATGYRVDVNRLSMLHPQMISKIQTYQNAPVLNNQFESSISGLYFVGFSSLASCGPLNRFVVGTDAASKRVANSVAHKVASVRKGNR